MVLVRPIYGNGWTDFITDGHIETPSSFSTSAELTGCGSLGTVISTNHIFQGFEASVKIYFEDKYTNTIIYSIELFLPPSPKVLFHGYAFVE